MDWIRGYPLARGSFATVHLAIPKSDSGSPVMVVKSSDLSTSGSLRNEREVLRRLDGRCPQVVRCFGDSCTSENGRRLYNLLFEYASGGSLSDHLRRSPGNRLSEFEVRKHTCSILRGLRFIHDCGFVHCDIKLQNILLFGDGEVKISDFGLAKETKKNEEKRGGFELRGTPMYMAPEVVAGSDGDAPADVWALGCAVVEMITGKPAWRCEPGCGVAELLCRIGAGNLSPEIPECLSEEGKDFLRKCFMKDSRERWTTRMLLDHPFVSGMGAEEKALCAGLKASPRCPFDFPDWTPTANMSEPFCSPDDCWVEVEVEEPCSSSILERVNTLAGNPIHTLDWSNSDLDGWVTVR